MTAIGVVAVLLTVKLVTAFYCGLSKFARCFLVSVHIVVYLCGLLTNTLCSLIPRLFMKCIP